MHLPDYKDGSIVNLMSSITGALGDKPKYNSLKVLRPEELRKSKNIVFIIIDGMGHEFLKKHGKDSFLYKNLRSRITSVFPSTTASAISTFRTGLAPAEHAITGWFMHFKELGGVGIPLRFRFRNGGRFNIDPKTLFPEKPIFDRIDRRSFMILPKDLAVSEYTKALSGKTRKLAYSTLNGFFLQIRKAVKMPRKKLIYAYWPDLDHLEHDFGTDHGVVLDHFREIDKEVESLSKSLKGTGSTLVITADHGLINIPEGHVINIEDHPGLLETLTLPLCGESRSVYCYVRPSKVWQFEKYIKKHLKEKCHMFKSEELLKKGWFGQGKPNQKILDRIGDYVLVMKKDYVLKDTMPGEKKSEHIGRHGGVSKEEMHVPLIIIKT